LNYEIEAGKITDTVLGGIALIKKNLPDSSLASNNRLEVVIATLGRIETLVSNAEKVTTCQL